MSTATAEVVQTKFEILPLAHITPSPMNPRKRFDDKALKELAESIKSHGVQQPIVVRPDGNKRDRYEIVVGERRFKASKLAGKTEIPALINSLSNSAALEIMVIENLQREDVHPFDEALGYEALMKKAADVDPELGELPGSPKHTVISIAAKVGKSVEYVYARLKLLALIPAGREAFEQDRITAGHAVLIARLQPADQVKALAACFGIGTQFELDRLRKIEVEKLTFDEITGEDPADEYRGAFMRSLIPEKGLRDWIQNNVNLKLKGVAWELDDALLVPGAGACETCPKRSMSNPSLFAELTKKGEDDTCFDPACFQSKQKAFVKLQIKIDRDTAEKENRKRYIDSVGPHDKSGQFEKVRPLVQISEQTAYTKPKEGEKVLKAGQWLRAKKGECEGVTRALIVRGENAGEYQTVCADLNCKVHKRHLQSSGTGFSPERSEENAKTAQEENRINDLVVEKVLTSVLAKIKKPDLKVLRTMFELMTANWYGDHRLVGRALGLECTDDNGAKAVGAFAKKADLAGMMRLVFLVSISEEMQVWTNGFKHIAKAFGIDIAKTRKEIEKVQTPAKPEKSAKPAKAKAKKAKAGR